MPTDFTQTNERCATCSRTLILDHNGHYVCLHCERNHVCMGFKDSPKPFGQHMKVPRKHV